MNVLLLQLDGKIPNIALMRISAHHKAMGDDVEFRWGRDFNSIRRTFWDKPDKVYASLIFERTKAIGEQVLKEFPGAVIGGTGWNVASTLEETGITTKEQDYTIYEGWKQSIGFTQRGCRLKCPFCVVPRKEGPVTEEQTIPKLWRGDPWPRELILLDNDFFGQPSWSKRIEEMKEGKFKVSFNQGINARFLNDESAAAIASVDYRDDQMKTKRIYTAWDNRKDEDRLFRGLEALVKYGVKPDHIMVYILLGYWPWSDLADWEYRRKQLREFGCRPYPMPYERTREAVGFQRWVVAAYDKRVTWEEWAGAGYEPRNITRKQEGQMEMFGQ